MSVDYIVNTVIGNPQHFHTLMHNFLFLHSLRNVFITLCHYCMICHLICHCPCYVCGLWMQC